MAARCTIRSNTLKGAFYSRLERALMNRTDLFLFESAFARDTYQRIIGTPKGLVRCVFNGVTADEFDPIIEGATTPPTSSMSASSGTSRAPTSWSTQWRGCAPTASRSR